MRKALPVTAAALLCAVLLCLVNCSGRNSVVTVKANGKVMELVKTWDPNVSFYTSKKNPLKSIEGLRQAEIGCFGPELDHYIQAFYDAAEINKEYEYAVQVIGPNNPIFVMERGPRLYLTWTKNAPKLKEAVRVKFSE